METGRAGLPGGTTRAGAGAGRDQRAARRTGRRPSSLHHVFALPLCQLCQMCHFRRKIPMKRTTMEKVSGSGRHIWHVADRRDRDPPHCCPRTGFRAGTGRIQPCLVESIWHSPGRGSRPGPGWPWRTSPARRGHRRYRIRPAGPASRTNRITRPFGSPAAANSSPGNRERRQLHGLAAGRDVPGSARAGADRPGDGSGSRRRSVVTDRSAFSPASGRFDTQEDDRTVLGGALKSRSSATVVRGRGGEA